MCSCTGLICQMLNFNIARVLFIVQFELPIFSSLTLELRFLGVSGEILHCSWHIRFSYYPMNTVPTLYYKYKVLHSVALHGWEQIKPLHISSAWSCRQPLLACSWNIATESPWLQRDQRHLQLGSHPLWDGKWHCAFQWDAAHLNAVGEVERSRSKTDGCINHGRASCSWRATRTPRCEHIILRWSTFTTSLQDFQATQLTLVWAIVWDLVAILSLAETPSTIRGSSLLNFTTWSLSALCWNPILGHQHLSYLLIPSSGSWRRPTPPCWLYFYPPSLF